MLLLSASASSLSSSAPHRIAGVLQSTDDIDHYRVELVAGHRYFFDMQSQHPLGLVRQADGAYWQVNGDIALQLNRSMVERALRGARPSGLPRGGLAARGVKVSAPLVSVRRRRALSQPTVALKS